MDIRGPGTGEVVEPTKAQKKDDKVLGTFPSRASIWKVLLASLRVFWPIYVVLFLMFDFTVVFAFSQMVTEHLEVVFVLPPVVVVYFVVLLVPLLLSFTFLEIRNDRVEVTKGSVRVIHHYMMNMLVIYNSIDITAIKGVRVAGKDYLDERKRRTKLLDRLVTNPRSPPGGLHFQFHDPKALLIIEMVRPVPIVNRSTLIEKRLRWGPSLKRVYVREVIVEVDREYHDRFISLMKKMIKGNDRRTKAR